MIQWGGWQDHLKGVYVAPVYYREDQPMGKHDDLEARVKRLETDLLGDWRSGGLTGRVCKVERRVTGLEKPLKDFDPVNDYGYRVTTTHTCGNLTLAPIKHNGGFEEVVLPHGGRPWSDEDILFYWDQQKDAVMHERAKRSRENARLKAKINELISKLAEVAIIARGA